MSVPTGARLALHLAVVPFWIVGAVLALHSGFHALDHFFDIADRQPWRFLHYQFNLNHEVNVATWVAAKLLLVSALLLLAVGLAHHAQGQPKALYWDALGGVFLLLSLDEMGSYHERISEALRDSLQLDGLLTNAWVLVAVPLVAMLFLALLPFLRSLPARTRWMMLIAGAVFLSGAVGVEVLSGLVRDVYGFRDPRFSLMTTLEETLEFLGVAILIHTLVKYMVEHNTLGVLVQASSSVRDTR